MRANRFSGPRQLSVVRDARPDPDLALVRASLQEALIFLPVWSIFINTLSHSNCDLLPTGKAHSILGFIRHHQSHHTHYHGNYGFFFNHLDRWFGTFRQPDAQSP